MRRLTALVGAFACAGTFVQAPAQTPPASDPIPIEYFTRHDEFGTIKISPDGETLALTTGKYGRSALVFFDRRQNKVVGGIRNPDGIQIEDFHWISPERVIYTVAERKAGRARPTPTGEIFAVNRDGDSNVQIYGVSSGQSSLGADLPARETSAASATVVSLLQNDANHILIAEYPWRKGSGVWWDDPDARPRVIRLDVYTGGKLQLDVAPLAGAKLIVDGNDQVRFATGRDEQQKFAVSWKPHANASWTSFALVGFREETIVPLRFSADNRAVYFTGTRAGESFAALYRLDLETRQTEQVAAFADAPVAAVVTDLAHRDVIGVSVYRERREYRWLSEQNAATKVYRALLRAFPGRTVDVTSTTRDGRLAIVFVRSDTNPGDYYLFDTSAMKADFLRAGRAWIDPQRMRAKEPFEMTARDGLPLHGYVTRPAGAPPYPLVVMPHWDVYDDRDSWEFEDGVQLLASRGYAVLQINYRGSAGYGEDFLRAGAREWGARIQDDISDATRRALEQKFAAPDRVCIYGFDFAGYAALMGAMREPKLYRCAIGYAGFYDLELMRRAAAIPNATRWGQKFLDWALGDDVIVMRARSPALHADQIEAAVLLIHGKKDAWLAYDQGTRMREALEKYGKRVEWLPLDGGGSNADDEATRRAVFERILAFLDRNLNSTGNVAASGPR